MVRYCGSECRPNDSQVQNQDEYPKFSGRVVGGPSDNRVLTVIILSITHWQGLVWLGQGAILYETGPVEEIFLLMATSNRLRWVWHGSEMASFGAVVVL